jgi:hypothetical protein
VPNEQCIAAPYLAVFPMNKQLFIVGEAPQAVPIAPPLPELFEENMQFSIVGLLGKKRGIPLSRQEIADPELFVIVKPFMTESSSSPL